VQPATIRRRTLSEALDDLVAGMNDGTIRSRNRRPFKPSVIRTYELWVEKRLKPELGHVRVANLTRNAVQDLIDRLHADGAKPQTIANIIMPLRVLYRRAIQRGEVTMSPLDHLELPAGGERRERVADPVEAELLLSALPTDDRALWATAIYAGLRRGELQALQVEDVDLEGGVIGVRRAWDAAAGFILPKSSAAVRQVPICETLARYLRDAVDGRRLSFAFADDAFDHGKVTRRAYSAWKAAGLERLTFHDARHTFRSYLDAVPAISEVRADAYMGHASHTLRARYTHTLPGQLAADAAALQAYLDGATSGQVVAIGAAS
jgi:integrase